MLGSSSVIEGNDGEKSASPLISSSEPQGSNTFTNERCLCNTRLPCIMTDVYFSDKRLSSTSFPSIIHQSFCSSLHSLLLTQCAHVLPCKSTKHPQVPDDIKKAPGTHHFTPTRAHTDLQPAAQKSSSSTTETRHSVGRNNNNLPKNLGVHPNPPASISRHITAIHCQVIFKKSWAEARC